MFGDLAMSYEVVPGVAPGRGSWSASRLPTPRGAGRLWQALLGAGDLVMIRHQLHRLRRYAEATDRA